MEKQQNASRNVNFYVSSVHCTAYTAYNIVIIINRENKAFNFFYILLNVPVINIDI
jgi:hypothetical protein